MTPGFALERLIAPASCASELLPLPTGTVSVLSPTEMVSEPDANVVFDANGLAATPLDALERALPLADTPGATMRWDDAAIPVVDLRRPNHVPAEEGQVLIVRAGERRAACVVARVHVMIPAGGGHLYRLGAGAFITTGDGREQASYRIVDLTPFTS